MRGLLYTLTAFYVLAMLPFSFVTRCLADEVSLFSSDGSPVAYIDTDDKLTIYLWGGQPVAYLEGRDGNAFHVWGFNGEHLGWFEKGAIWEPSGNATCAVREALSGFAKFEPFKPFKKFKPFKSFQTFAPFKPFLSGRFGLLPCSIHLIAGSK